MALVEGARESHWLGSAAAPPYCAPACRILGGPAAGNGKLSHTSAKTGTLMLGSLHQPSTVPARDPRRCGSSETRLINSSGGICPRGEERTTCRQGWLGSTPPGWAISVPSYCARSGRSGRPTTLRSSEKASSIAEEQRRV